MSLHRSEHGRSHQPLRQLQAGFIACEDHTRRPERRVAAGTRTGSAVVAADLGSPAGPAIPLAGRNAIRSLNRMRLPAGRQPKTATWLMASAMVARYVAEVMQRRGKVCRPQNAGEPADGAIPETVPAAEEGRAQADRGRGLRSQLKAASPALKFVLMVGVMSFFADFTYEGSRSVIGPYLGTLGAGALAISIISGLGEFLGYGLRLFSGRSADRTRRYWPITISGYVVQMAGWHLPRWPSRPS